MITESYQGVPAQFKYFKPDAQMEIQGSSKLSALLNPQEQKSIDFSKGMKIKFYAPEMMHAKTNIQNAGCLNKNMAVALNIEIDIPGSIISSDRVYEMVFDNAHEAEEFVRGMTFALRSSNERILDSDLFDNKVYNCCSFNLSLLSIIFINEYAHIDALQDEFFARTSLSPRLALSNPRLNFQPVFQSACCFFRFGPSCRAASEMFGWGSYCVMFCCETYTQGGLVCDTPTSIHEQEKKTTTSTFVYCCQIEKAMCECQMIKTFSLKVNFI